MSGAALVDRLAVDRRVDQVSTTDVLAVLNPVWNTKPELARKLRQRLSMAFVERSSQMAPSLVRSWRSCYSQ